jgi:hypothetical protein
VRYALCFRLRLNTMHLRSKVLRPPRIKTIALRRYGAHSAVLRSNIMPWAQCRYTQHSGNGNACKRA